MWAPGEATIEGEAPGGVELISVVEWVEANAPDLSDSVDGPDQTKGFRARPMDGADALGPIELLSDRTGRLR